MADSYASATIYRIAADFLRPARPYYLIQLAGQPSVSNDPTPGKLYKIVWKTQRLTFSLTKQEIAEETLTLTVWDKGGKIVGGDRLVGYCQIPCYQMVTRHYPASGDLEESTAIKVPLFKKQKKKGEIKLFVEASGWRCLFDMLQASDEERSVALSNLRQLSSSKGPKVGAYIQYSLLEYLANALMRLTEFVVKERDHRRRHQERSSRRSREEKAGQKSGKHKSRRKHDSSDESSVRERVNSDSSAEGAPIISTVDEEKELEISHLSEIWLSLSRLEPSIRSRLVRVGVMKLFLVLLRHRESSIKLVILECLKTFFTSTAHQTEMINVGIVDRLIELLSSRDPSVQNKAFDVLLYFDERQQPQILGKGILKALIRLIKKDSRPQLKTRALEMILYFNSQDCQKELLSAGVLKDLVELSIDGGSNAKTATSLVLKVLSVLRHFDVTYRDALIADHIVEPMIGLLKLDDEKITLQTFSVLDEFIETHESALISAGLLSAIATLVMSSQIDVRMKAFDTMSRLRLHTNEIVEGGLLAQLIQLLTDTDMDIQLRAFKLLSSYMQQMPQKILVDAGILHQLVRVLSPKWVSRPNLYGLVFEFFQKFDDQYQQAMIEIGIIENIMDLLRMPLLGLEHKEAALAFIMWLRPSCHIEAMSRGIVTEIVSAAKSHHQLQREALATLTSLSGWMAFAAETPSILNMLVEILLSQTASTPVAERVLEIFENFPDLKLLCDLRLPKSLLDFLLPGVYRSEMLAIRAAKLFVSLKPSPTKELMTALFAVAREAPMEACLITLDIFAKFNVEDQKVAVESCDCIQHLLDCASTSRPDELRIKCLDVLSSLPNYKAILEKHSLGKHLLSLLSGKAEAFQLRVVQLLRQVGVTSDLLIDDGLVPRMMRTIYSAVSDQLSAACMSVLEDLNARGGLKLVDHLISRKEPDVLDIYTARLNPRLCHPALEITNNLLSVCANANPKKLWRTVICDKGIVNGVKSWEVVLDRCTGGNIMIGVCTRDHPLNTYIGQSSSFRGWSYYGGASGYTYHDGVCNPSYGTRMKQGQVITVTLDVTANTLAFSVNGKFLGVAFSSGFEGLELFPAVSMYDAGDQITFREAGSPATKHTEGPSKATPRFLHPKTSSLLNRWIGENLQQRWVLLYKASDHGWSSSEFHNRCDSRGPTITIVRTAKGAEFGGYASVSWEKERGYRADPNAFLFSITTIDGKPTETVHGQYAHLNCAIYSQTKYGPSFGNGFDLYINLDYPSSSYAHLGHTYRPPSFDQQNIHLSGTSGSWGKHDVEVYGKFTDSVMPSNVRLLNQFIRLLTVPTPTMFERVSRLLVESFAVTHRKEVLKELHRLLADRRQPAELKSMMKNILSRIQFPGLACIVFEAFDTMITPISKVSIPPGGYADVVLRLDLSDAPVDHSDSSPILPYLTHVIMSSRSLLGDKSASSSVPIADAVVFAAAQALPDLSVVEQYSFGLTEQSLLEFWPQEAPVTPRTVLALSESNEGSDDSDSDVEYVDQSLDKIKFPGLSTPQKSQIFGPLPPPMPASSPALRLSDSSVPTKKADPLLPSPRTKQGAVKVVRPLTSSIPSRITPQQLPRSMPSYMGVIPGPSQSSTSSATTTATETDDVAASKRAVSSPALPKTAVSVPPLSLAKSTEIPTTSPSPRGNNSSDEKSAPDSVVGRSHGSASAPEIKTPKIKDGRSFSSMPSSSVISGKETDRNSIPSLKPAISGLRHSGSNPPTPRNTSTPGEGKSEKRSPREPKVSPRRTPRAVPTTPRKEKEKEKEKERDSTTKRPKSDERTRSKKANSKTLSGHRRGPESNSSRVARLRRTNSSTAVHHTPLRSGGGSRRPSGTKRPGSPDKASRRAVERPKFLESAATLPVFFDDELHRSAGSDSEQPASSRRSISKRSLPVSSQSFASVHHSHRRTESVPESSTATNGKRSPVRPTLVNNSANNPLPHKDLTSSDDSSDVATTPRLPPKPAAAETDRQSTSASSVMYIYLNDNNQKVRTKDEAYVDLSEPRRVRYRVLWIATNKIGFVDEITALDDCGYDPSTDPDSFISPATALEDSDEWEDSSALLAVAPNTNEPVKVPELTISPGTRPTSPARDAGSPVRSTAPTSPDGSLLSPKSAIEDSAIGGSEDVDLSDVASPRSPVNVVSPQPSRSIVTSPLLQHIQHLDNSGSSASKAITASREQLAQSRASDGSDSKPNNSSNHHRRSSNKDVASGKHHSSSNNHHRHWARSSRNSRSLTLSNKSGMSATYEDSLPLSDSFEDDPMDKVRASLSMRKARRARNRIFRRSGALSDSETVGLSASLAGTEDFEEAEEEEPRKPTARAPSVIPNEGASSDSISSSESYEKAMRDSSPRTPHPKTPRRRRGTDPLKTSFVGMRSEDLSDDALSGSIRSSKSVLPPQVKRVMESFAGSETAASQEDSSEASSVQQQQHIDLSVSKQLPEESEIEMSDSRDHSLSSLSLSVSVAKYDKTNMKKDKGVHSESSSSALEDDAEEPEEEHSLRRMSNYVYADGPDQDDAGSDPEESAPTVRPARRRALSTHSSHHVEDSVSSFSLSLSGTNSPRDQNVEESINFDSRDVINRLGELTPVPEEQLDLSNQPDSDVEVQNIVDDSEVDIAKTYSTFLLSPPRIIIVETLPAPNPVVPDDPMADIHSADFRFESEHVFDDLSGEAGALSDELTPEATVVPSSHSSMSSSDTEPSIPSKIQFAPDSPFPLALVPIPATGFVEHPLAKATRAQWVLLRFRRSSEDTGDQKVIELKHLSLVAFLPWNVRPDTPVPIPQSLTGVAEGIGIIKRSLKSFFYVSDFDQNGLLYWLGRNEGKLATYKNPAILGKVNVQTSHAMFEAKMLSENIIGRNDVSTFWGGSVPQWFSLDLGRYEIYVTHYTMKHGYHLANSYLQNFQFQGSKDNVNWVTLHEQSNPCFHRQFDVTTFRISDGKDYFRYFRVVQNGFYAMGNGQTGGPFMCLSGFELYGEMRSFEPI
eukprot:TRINITY_DN4631_c0_g1_i1.p1 TRINITY_DN4631_c0_g1~~TRINITY_DN4631_c0_g1_i1.p1  ORF type:complete len:2986 (-),score=498.77 TRINITY_DN4631_c0_g1_i1:15-8972(-)